MASGSLERLSGNTASGEAIREADGFIPLVRPLPKDYTPKFCFERLSRLADCVWLDSNMHDTSSASQRPLGRYSYLAAEPFSRLRIEKPNSTAIENLARLIAMYRQPKLSGLPPMQGGWMGWFGYELGQSFERLAAARYNEFQLPAAVLGLYDVVLSWDHELNQGWIVSQGWPTRESAARHKRAYRRMQSLLDRLDAPIDEFTKSANSSQAAIKSNVLSTSRLAPQFATRWSDAWTSNFSAADYRNAVSRCVDYIHDGDIFQVNLSQRLLRRAACDSASLYRHLRQASPATFSGYADFGRVQVLSTSPERFLQLHDGRLEARPIKGTRPRMSDPVADAGIAELLKGSEKDRSENVMIVDLLRNDLSRVSSHDSVRVSDLCNIEKYPFVWHIVSVIESKLRQGLGACDVIQSTFPGGSITGAPKIRAMEIIAELEPTARGPYCGSLGYISFAGDMDLNILIRTITAADGWWQVPVGGGIVADSDPHLEEQETWHKAEGILRAIDSLKQNTFHESA